MFVIGVALSYQFSYYQESCVNCVSPNLLIFMLYLFSYLLVRFELFFNFVLPNFVCANVAVVKRTGSWCCRARNVEDEAPVAFPDDEFECGTGPDGLVLDKDSELLYIGLADDVGDASFGDPLGLNVSPFKDEPMISIGRKHCASGLKVVVTSRSALLSSAESCFCSE